MPTTRRTPHDFTRSDSTQPYRTTRAAQRIAQRARTITVTTPDGSQHTYTDHHAGTRADAAARAWRRHPAARAIAINGTPAPRTPLFNADDETIRIYEANGRTTTLHPLTDVLSPRTLATLRQLTKGSRNG